MYRQVNSEQRIVNQAVEQPNETDAIFQLEFQFCIFNLDGYERVPGLYCVRCTTICHMLKARYLQMSVHWYIQYAWPMDIQM